MANHTSNALSNSQATILALASSAATAAVVYWWARRTSMLRTAVAKDDDDFDAGQTQPTSKNETHVLYKHQRLSMDQIRRRSQKLLRTCQQRRTLRFFSTARVPKDIILSCLETACTAPSGAHKQPWTFVAISNHKIKQEIRSMVEKEETKNYDTRMRKSWVDDLKPMMNNLHSDVFENNTTDTDSKDGSTASSTPIIEKPYLTEAPWLIAVFKQTSGGTDPTTGKRIDHYYVQESVGIACGMLITAIQNANMVSLTSTPMGAEKAIRELLQRPDHEKLFLLIPVGFPAVDATVPYRNPERKPLSKTIVWKQ